MTTTQFLQIAPKITATNLFSNLAKGQHGKYLLGWRMFGTTESHYKHIWRAYGTIRNLITDVSAEEANEILAKHGITEFKAVQTKSGRFARLIESK